MDLPTASRQVSPPSRNGVVEMRARQQQEGAGGRLQRPGDLGGGCHHLLGSFHPNYPGDPGCGLLKVPEEESAHPV